MEQHRRHASSRGRRLRPDSRQERADRLTRRLLLELTAAAALFALYLAAGAIAPRQAARWQETLGGLLTASCDLWGACERLGEDLSQGEDVLTSVGEWCVSVFLPAGAGETEEDALTEPETADDAAGP